MIRIDLQHNTIQIEVLFEGFKKKRIGDRGDIP